MRGRPASARSSGNSPAGRDVLGVVGEQLASEHDHPAHLAVGDPVIDRAVLAPRGDKAAPAQAGEVVGDARLGEAEPLDQVTYGQLALGLERFEDPQPRLVGENAEVFGEQLRLGGDARDLEGSGSDRASWHRYI